MAKKFLNRFEHLERAGNSIKEDEYAVKNKIKALKELEDFIPALSEEEFEQLEINIKNEGCRDPLVIWKSPEKKYIIVDGHNRFKICKKLQKDFKIEIREDFSNLDDIKEWMLTNQFGRRNLTKIQIAKIRGMHYNKIKNKLGGYANIEKGKESKVQNEPSISTENTAEKIGNLHKVDSSTIKRDAMIATGLEKLSKNNPMLEKEILMGNVKVNKSQLQGLSKLDDVPRMDSIEEISKLLRESNNEQKQLANTPDKKLKEAKRKIISLLNQIEKERDKKLFTQVKKEIKYFEGLM